MKLTQLLAAIRFLFRKRLTISTDVIDYQVRDFSYQLTPQNIQDYNDVVKNGKSQFAPIQNPVFFCKITWQILEKLEQFIEQPFDKALLLNLVHQSEVITNYQPLNPESKITVKSRIWSITAARKGTKMVVKFEFYEGDKLIASSFSTGILYGVKCNGEARSLGDVPKTKRINKEPIWTESITVDRNLPFEYATKAEIDAGIHTDEAFAKSIGLPDIILQGTCSFAKAIEKITEKELSNREFKLHSVSTKFTGMLVPPNNLTVRLLDKDQNTFYFDVLNQSGDAVLRGGQLKYFINNFY